MQRAYLELIETTASNRDHREQSDEHAGKKNDGEPSFSIDALFHKQAGLKTQLT